MDLTTLLILGGFAGALLNGLMTYWSVHSEEEFVASKFSQTIITAIITGLLAAMIALETLSPEANPIVVFILGLFAGYGADASRVKAGIKVS